MTMFSLCCATLFERLHLLRYIPRADAPFLRIKVVGTVAEMFGETERKLFVTDQYVAFLCTGG